MTQRILILSANFGSGHLQAAQAIAAGCMAAEPRCEAIAANVNHPLVSAVSGGYLKLLAHAPGVYRRLYRQAPGHAVRTLVAATFMPPVQQLIAEVQPTVVVATHPFPGAAAALLRTQRKLNAPVLMAVTDFVPHPLWLHPGADAYFVATEPALLRLVGLGVSPERIAVTGIPIRRGFAAVAAGFRRDAAVVRNVLVMGGGLGLGPIVEAVRSLVEIDRRELRITVVAGRNRELQRDLSDLFGSDERVRVLGETNLVPELMGESDLLVTKPGGMTCSEALTSGLPMLLLPPLPGQEEENVEYLTATGAAMSVPVDAIGPAASALLFAAPAFAADRPSVLPAMQQAAQRAARPEAARQIAETAIAMVQRQPAAVPLRIDLRPQPLPD